MIPSTKNSVVKRLLDLGYAGVGSEELLKKEVSLAAGQRLDQGITGITMQISSGRSNELVGADVQGLIFHKEMYDPVNNPTLRQEIKKQIGSVKQELQDLQEGKISSRLRKRIERAVNIDPDDWQNLRFKSPASAVKFRQDALALQSALLQGQTKIENLPTLLNDAAKMLAEDLYTTVKQMDIVTPDGNYKPNVYLNLPKLPFSQRNAIDTEERVANSAGRIVLGDLFDDRRKIRTNIDGVGEVDLDLFQFRLNKHKFLLSGSGANRLFDAFGGFDLDDKVISDLSFITDTSGARRLTSFVWRQPTGPQEYALMFPHLDEGTLERLLGSDTLFGERFQELSAAVSDSVSQKKFGRIPTASSTITALELDQLTQEEKILKYVSLMANGKKPEAKRYIEGMDQNAPEFFEKVEKAIFRITDVGNKTSKGVVMGLEYGNELEGTSIGITDILKNLHGHSEVQEIDNRFITMQSIPQKILEKVQKGRFGTGLSMTAEEASQVGYGAQYRSSGFIKMFETKASLIEDDYMIKQMSGLIDENQTVFGGQSSKQILDNVKNTTMAKMKKGPTGAPIRTLGDTETVYRFAGEILGDETGKYSKDLQLKVEQIINQALNQQQYQALAASDNLGIYVNKLGLASSIDSQSGDGMTSIINKIAELEKAGGLPDGLNVNDVKAALNELKAKSVLVYSPESAIDAALSRRWDIP